MFKLENRFIFKCSKLIQVDLIILEKKMRLSYLISVLLWELRIDCNPFHICLLQDTIFKIAIRFELFFIEDKKEKLVSHKFLYLFWIFAVLVFCLITLLKLYLYEACFVWTIVSMDFHLFFVNTNKLLLIELHIPL